MTDQQQPLTETQALAWLHGHPLRTRTGPERRAARPPPAARPDRRSVKREHVLSRPLGPRRRDRPSRSVHRRDPGAEGANGANPPMGARGATWSRTTRPGRHGRAEQDLKTGVAVVHGVPIMEAK